MRFLALVRVGGMALVSTATATAQTPILTDPFNNPVAGQHKTVVEPDTFSNGSTIVAAGQIGRIFDGGAAGIGATTSTDNGASWTSSTLPGITTAAGGSYDRGTDPSVAY